MADIFVFGDSIGYGAWDEKGGWVDRLKQYFHSQKLAHPNEQVTEVYNLSVDGDKSKDVAKRIEAELSARQRPWSSENDLVLVAIGTNDTHAQDTPNNFRYSTEDYLSNLNIIAKVVHQHEKKLTFISLDPVDEARTNPIAEGTHFWTNKRIREFNETLNEFCKSQNIPFLDIFDSYLKEPNFSNFFFDGLHPNSEGHEWMYKKIKPSVLDLLS